jgi:Ca2+-transporting ATPase
LTLATSPPGPGTDLSRGLSAADAARRLPEQGPNELVDRGGRPATVILWSQLTGTMVLLLIAAEVVSAAVGDFTDAIAIVILNAILGFIQECRAERAMSALKQLAVPRVRVRCDDDVREIPARFRPGRRHAARGRERGGPRMRASCRLRTCERRRRR